jgi:hypothetical protein
MATNNRVREDKNAWKERERLENGFLWLEAVFPLFFATSCLHYLFFSRCRILTFLNGPNNLARKKSLEKGMQMAFCANALRDHLPAFLSAISTNYAKLSIRFQPKFWHNLSSQQPATFSPFVWELHCCCLISQPISTFTVSQLNSK